MKIVEKDWSKVPLDYDFMLDSGLLFEVNRQFFHPLGIAITVILDKNGNKAWGFKDLRQSPSELKFDLGTLEVGRRKFVRFMKAFGDKQIHKRIKAMGKSSQHVEPSWD